MESQILAGYKGPNEQFYFERSHILGIEAVWVIDCSLCDVDPEHSKHAQSVRMQVTQQLGCFQLS